MLKSYFIIATRLKIFLQLILRNGVSFHPKFLLRLPFLFQSSVWTSFLVFRENIMFGRKIKKTRIPNDPIFIIGHWRTGSTLLHQLFSCDPQFIVPTLLQCTYPDSFLGSKKFIAPVMKQFLPEKRPMDNVLLGHGDPQEDEYALFRLTTFSPLERLIFPHSSDYFILGDEDFLPEGPHLQKWKQALIHFATKLHMDSSGERIVFKNPFHSPRISVLKEMFPNARFIHTYRDPRVVIPSTMHMWKVVGNENTLRREWSPPQLEDVIKGFDTIVNRVDKEFSVLPEDKYVEVCFEELEKDPVKMIQKIYSHFGFDISESCQSRLEAFLKKTSGYKKNKYNLDKEQEDIICSRLKGYMERFGYLG